MRFLQLRYSATCQASSKWFSNRKSLDQFCKDQDDPEFEIYKIQVVDVPTKKAALLRFLNHHDISE